MKLKRSKIEAHVQPHVDGWFEAKGRVVWS
jgi:hypothetical protein